MLGKKKKGKVALVVPPSLYSAPIGWDIASRAPLEGATIAGSLLLPKFEVLGYDLRVLHDGQRKLLETIGDLSAICITGTPDSYPFVKQFSHLVFEKRPDLRIILGGPLATYSHDTVLRTTNIKECIIGDCELSLLEIVSAPSIQGFESKFYVAYKTDSGEVVKTPLPQRPQRMPGIDMNDECVVPKPNYKQVWRTTYGEAYTPRLVYYATQRGCGFQCAFCAENRAVSSARYTKLHDDILYLVRDQGVRELFFSDPTFNTSEEHCRTVIGVLSEVSDKCDAELKWSCQVRAVMPLKGRTTPMPIPNELLQDMHSSGCKAIFVGIESADTELLTWAEKKITVPAVEETVKRAHGKGIEVHGFIMLGLPGEDDNSLQKTLRLAYETPFFPRVRYAMPLPGTSLFEQELKARQTEQQNITPGQFEEIVLNEMANWQNTPLDKPFALTLRGKGARIIDAMRLMSWRFLELPDIDQSRFAEHKHEIENRFQRWMTHCDIGVKPLFFPSQKTESSIERRLKSLLQKTIAEQHNIANVKIGRILVYGCIPHLVWSASEVYRPVCFIFGKLDNTCHACSLKNTDPKNDSPYSILSPKWKRSILRFSGKKAQFHQVPPCWNESFLSKPYSNESHLPDCCLNKHSNRKPGCWSALDVLLLSRMRLRRWALLKREILQTPAAGARADRNVLKLYHPSELGRKTDNDNVSLASLVRRGNSPFSAYERYSNAFGAESWEMARIWAVTKPKEGPVGKLKEFTEWLKKSGFKDAKLAPEDWNKAREQNEPNRWLGEDCSTFLDKQGKPVLQGSLSVGGLNTEAFIYFEILNSEDILSKWPSAKREAPAPLADDHKLIDFSQSVLLPWIDVLKMADDRWENHQAMDGVFPSAMRSTLLDVTSPAIEEVGTLRKEQYDSASFLQDVRNAERLYSRRVIEEEASPVQLALALMGDMWKFSFRGILVPRYSEFERFQQLLKAMPEYRDHLTHSIQVFLLGNRIIEALAPDSSDTDLLCMAERYGDHVQGVNTLPLQARTNQAVLKFQWAIASLMHDFALPAEKANEVVNHLFGTFLAISSKGEYGTDGLKDVLDIEEKKHKAILFTLLAKTEMGAETLPHPSGSLFSPIASEVTYQQLAEDHGFLSAIYLFNQMFVKGTDWWELKQDVQNLLATLLGLKGEALPLSTRISECLVLEVLDAVVKHNAFSKEFRLTSNEDPVYRYSDSFFSADQSIFRSSIPGLLMLCDTLCDWGRVIHADELRNHDIKGTTAELKRPECQITRVDADNGVVTVQAQYYWRLPCIHGIGKRVWCLAEIYRCLVDEMWPYTPGFDLGNGCLTCIIRKDAYSDRVNPSCPQVRTLERFWNQLLIGEREDCKRLRFPPLYNQTFNKIQLRIEFYGHTVCSGNLTGVKPTA